LLYLYWDKITSIYTSAELLRDQEHLRQLMGDTTEDQRRKLEERLRRRRERLAQGIISTSALCFNLAGTIISQTCVSPHPIKLENSNYCLSGIILDHFQDS